MSFLGKIFVVLIFILSIIFMTLAAVVYGTQKNWEALAKQTQAKLSEATTDFDQLKDQYNRETGELEAKREAALQQLRKLEAERDRLQGRNVEIQAQIDQLFEANREATAAVDAAEQDNLRLTNENDTLRKEVRQVQAKTDDSLKQALEATEALNNLQGEAEINAERAADLIAETTRMRAILTENDINPDLPFDAVTPAVDGMVSKTARRGGSILVEVTIGSDDGLQEGDTVDVFRNSKYLGRVKILKTAPDRAVGRVDTRFQEGRIQEGDRVATRLRVG
ncbi:MAG: hypothetical protein AAGJ46_16725 [Planctomycetota bacterium]